MERGDWVSRDHRSRYVGSTVECLLCGSGQGLAELQARTSIFLIYLGNVPSRANTELIPNFVSAHVINGTRFCSIYE